MKLAKRFLAIGMWAGILPVFTLCLVCWVPFTVTGFLVTGRWFHWDEPFGWYVDYLINLQADLS